MDILRLMEERERKRDDYHSKQHHQVALNHSDLESANLDSASLSRKSPQARLQKNKNLSNLTTELTSEREELKHEHYQMVQHSYRAVSLIEEESSRLI